MTPLTLCFRLAITIVVTATVAHATPAAIIPAVSSTAAFSFAARSSKSIYRRALSFDGIDGGVGSNSATAHRRRPYSWSAARSPKASATAVAPIFASRGGSGRSRRRRAQQKNGDGLGKSDGNVGNSESESSPTPSSGNGSRGGGKIYSLPALYDLAFGYRDYDDEVEFLLHAHHDATGMGKERERKSGNEREGGIRILELAAGPAHHSLTALSNYPPDVVNSTVALDLSRDMLEYSIGLADEQLGEVRGDGARRDDIRYAWGMMQNAGEALVSDGVAGGQDDGETEMLSTLPKFDTAWLLLGSMQHLLTNNAVVSFLESMSSLLHDEDESGGGGSLIIELPHPRETFAMGECTRNGWTVPLDDETGAGCGELNVIWGDKDDPFDPVQQVRNFTVVMEWNGGKDFDVEGVDPPPMQSARETVPLRLFTFQEIDALARCAGFEVTAKYGALDTDCVSIAEEEEAYRMVCVLRKKGAKKREKGANKR